MVVFLLLSQVVMPLSALASEPTGPVEPPEDGVEYNPSVPIAIHSNAQMRAAATTRGWSGSGTSTSPFIIEGYEINGSIRNHCLLLSNVTYHVEVRANKLYGVEYSGNLWDMWRNAVVGMNNCTNLVISGNEIGPTGWIAMYQAGCRVEYHDNTFTDALMAVGLEDVGSADVVNNEISGSLLGVVVLRGGNVTIEGNVITTESHYGSGIDIDYTHDVEIRDNDLYDLWTGVEADYADRLRFIDNTVGECWAPMWLWECHDSLLDGNGIAANESGSSFGYCFRLTLRNNSFSKAGFALNGYEIGHYSSHDIDTSNTFHGKPIEYMVNRTRVTIPSDRGMVYLVGCNDTSLEGKTLPTKFGGIWMAFCDGVHIGNSTICNDFNTTVRWVDTDNVTLVGNDLARVFVQGEYGSNCKVVGNTLDDGVIGSYRGRGWEVRDNKVTTTYEDGLSLYRCQSMSVINNTVTILNAGPLHTTVYMYSSTNVLLRDNTLDGAMVMMSGSLYEYYTSHDIDTSNTLGGQPILFLKNRSMEVGPGSYGQVILANCSNFTVRGLEMDGPGSMIHVAFSENGEVSRNMLRGQVVPAVFIYRSDNIDVSKNLIDNTFYGAYLYYSDDCTVSGNYVSSADPGLRIYRVNRAKVTRNYLSGCAGGIYGPYGLDGSEVSYNLVEGSKEYGIAIDGDYSTVHHNVLVDNNRSSETGLIEGPQAYSEGYRTTWNDSSEGNYWSDYRDKYPSATNDGNVWSTPYDLAGPWEHQDEHPLVDHFDPVPPIAFPEFFKVSVDPGDTVDFSAWRSIDNDAIASIRWSFDYDGSQVVLTGANVSHTFVIGGAYVVTLAVEDVSGNVDTVEVRVYVGVAEPPKADAGGDIWIDQGETARFDGSLTVAERKWANFTWRFTYGNEDVEVYGETPSFRFDIAGTYLVRLTVNVTGFIDTDTVRVHVRDTEVPVLELGEDLVIDQGDSVLLVANATDNVGVEFYGWVIRSGDDMVYSWEGPELGHRFNDAGNFTVTLTVWDAMDNTATDTINVTVRDSQPPVVRLPSDYEIDQGDSVTISASECSDNVGIVGYKWTVLLDEEVVHTATGMDFRYTFDRAGSFQVRLNVSDAEGNWVTGTVDVEVRDTEPPVADAGQDILANIGELVRFNGTGSTDNVRVVSWRWKLDYEGREITLSGATPTMTFHVPGEYIVELSVRDAAGHTAKAAITLTVRDIEAPVADVVAPSVADLDSMVRFDGSGSVDNIGVEDWDWTFHYQGRTVVLDGMQPDWTFEELGEFSINLTVRDAVGNSDSIEFTILIVDGEDPLAIAQGPPTTRVRDTVTLDGSASTDNVGIVRWNWTISRGGLKETLSGRTVEHTFSRPGQYVVMLEVFDAAGRSSSDTFTITVEEAEPEGLSGWLLMAVVVLVVAVVVAYAVVSRRTGGKDER